jgi:hypothetical protein
VTNSCSVCCQYSDVYLIAFLLDMIAVAFLTGIDDERLDAGDNDDVVGLATITTCLFSSGCRRA